MHRCTEPPKAICAIQRNHTKMRTPCCHSFLAFVLKFFNFLQTFIGVSLILYSVYMLNQWNKHPHSPPNSSQSPLNPDVFLLNFDAARVSDHVKPLNLASGVVSGIKDELKLYSRELPAPWYF